jgi:hypothetical protein
MRKDGRAWRAPCVICPSAPASRPRRSHGVRSGGKRWPSPRSTRSRPPYSLIISRRHRTLATSRGSRSSPDQSMFSWAEPPVSPSPSPDSDVDWMTTVATWPLSFFDLLAAHAPAGWCGRMCPESCRRAEDGTLEPSSGAWKNSGMGGPTESWTLNTSEYPSAGVASSLSDILETGDVPQRYFLSATACRGILRRAAKRCRELPLQLRRALEVRAETEGRLSHTTSSAWPRTATTTLSRPT